MTSLAMSFMILNALRSRPSRASAAAIGHRFVLSEPPPLLARLAMDALANMPCDWSIAILEEIVNAKEKKKHIRRYAIHKLSEVLARAIEQGYPGINRKAARSLFRRAKARLSSDFEAAENPDVEEMCNHIGEALDRGMFKRLPDF